MGYTLTEAENYARDALLAGLVETIVEENPMAGLLQFEGFRGNAFAYNRETTLPGADFYDVGETWVESTPVVTKVTAKLKILGGDADVDKFLRATRGPENDLESTTILQKAKAVARLWGNECVYGSTALNPKGFDGLHVLVPTAQTVNMSADATPDAGTFAKLEEMIDLVRPGKPDFLMLTRRTRRAMNAGARTLGGGNAFVVAPGVLGPQTISYLGIPVLVCDFMVDTETITAGGLYSLKTGSTASSVFAIKTGVENYGLIGLEPEGEGGIRVEAVGTLETKDAARERVKWYTTLALLSTVAIARLTGLSAAAFTT